MMVNSYQATNSISLHMANWDEPSFGMDFSAQTVHFSLHPASAHSMEDEIRALRAAARYNVI